MAFTDQQARQLKAKLDAQHVKTRKANGATLITSKAGMPSPRPTAYLGSMAGIAGHCSPIAFGPERASDDYLAAYTAKVRIHVRAGEVTIVREGSGTGEGRAATPGQAHEIALKSAETDATKRALATFGNVFGLALYDREQGVRQNPKGKPSSEPTPKDLGDAPQEPSRQL